MRPKNEKIWATICHVANAVPLWGLLFCGWVWFDHREKSRYLVDQARQAMFFHGLFLAAVFIWICVSLVSKLILVLFTPLGAVLGFFNTLIMISLLAVYVVICIQGAFSSWTHEGEPYRYPLVGDRLD